MKGGGHRPTPPVIRRYPSGRRKRFLEWLEERLLPR